MSEAPERTLADIARHLGELGIPFALVGGLAVSVRSEVRFTRDVDLAIAVATDAQVEALVRELRGVGYRPIALVEHESRGRLATVRLESSTGIVVDLLAASSGIEAEVVAHATRVRFADAGDIPVARPEELLALKLLAITESRLQDRIDGANLLLTNPSLDMAAVRQDLALIAERGYDRGQDLLAKLEALVAEARRAAR